MKNPLHYQLSEYDCGPTSMMNALAYLFEREEIPPEQSEIRCFTVWTATAKKESQAKEALPEQR